MAVLTCKRMDDHRGDESDQNRRLIEMYRIITDSDSDEPSTILDDPLETIPRVGDPHPIDAEVTVKNRRVTFTGARNVYTMEVTYDNNVDSQSPSGGGGGGAIEVLEVTLGSWWEDYILEYAINVNAPAVARDPLSADGPDSLGSLERVECPGSVLE